MGIDEKYSQALGELFDGIDNGDFNDVTAIPEKYKFSHLVALFHFAPHLDGGTTLFEQLYDMAIANGKAHIKEKIKNKEKINVAFSLYSASIWNSEKLYRALEQDDRFNVYIIVSPNNDNFEEYEKAYCYFKQNKYNVKGVYNFATESFLTWDDFGGYPDIHINLSSWYGAYPESFQFINIPLRCINIYVPYAFYVAENPNISFTEKFVYNKEIMNLVWRLYVESQYTKSQHETYQLLHGKNVVYSGFLKLDEFYDKKKYTDEDLKNIWSIPKENNPSEIKKIIIAPHWTVGQNELLPFSTFRQNYKFLYELAKENKDLAFIFKPHPNLRTEAVYSGMFKDFEAYDKYIAKWNALPNAKVVTESSYIDIFKTSDAMIMDSGSFIGEYQYAHKPLLYLTRPEQAFTELGQRIMDTYYKVPGDDYKGINAFVKNVVRNGDDPKKKDRDAIFNAELDYKKINGCLAWEMIYKDIESLFE